MPLPWRLRRRSAVSAYQTFGYRVSFVIALIFSLAIIVVIRFTGDKGEPENTGEERNDTERADAEGLKQKILEGDLRMKNRKGGWS